MSEYQNSHLTLRLSIIFFKFSKLMYSLTWKTLLASPLLIKSIILLPNELYNVLIKHKEPNYINPVLLLIIIILFLTYTAADDQSNRIGVEPLQFIDN